MSPTAPAPVIVPLVEVKLMLAPVPVEPEFLIAAALAILPVESMLMVLATPELVIGAVAVRFTPVLVVVATLPKTLILPVAVNALLMLTALV